MSLVRAAGGLVVRDGSARKGKAEDGESDARGRPKRVRWCAMRSPGGTFEPTSEVDELRWVSAGDAEDLPSYERDRRLLGALP